MLPITLAFDLESFDLGKFEIENGKISGEYLPAEFEKISCFSQGRHMMDIIYENNSIEISIQFSDALERIAERDPLLKEELKKAFMPIDISGPSFTVRYGDCTVELHAISIRFLKICADKIIFSSEGYTIQKIDENMIKMEKENFSAVLISDNHMDIDDNITAYGNLMLFSFSNIAKEEIKEAFKNKFIGGEITIDGYDIKNNTDSISYFGNVSIEPVSIGEKKILLNVKGDADSGGKVIKINLGNKVCLSDEFSVKFEGKEISKADSFEDVLNPNDDSLYPEYYKLQSPGEGVFILISIPHFSEYQVSIEFIVENVAGNTLAILFGLFVIFFAAFYIFRS